ncbi:hypothetical protein ACWC0C_19105, partial [Streptomyces sp. NPDC001709]
TRDTKSTSGCSANASRICSAVTAVWKGTETSYRPQMFWGRQAHLHDAVCQRVLAAIVGDWSSA